MQLSKVMRVEARLVVTKEGRFREISLKVVRTDPTSTLRQLRVGLGPGGQPQLEPEEGKKKKEVEGGSTTYTLSLLRSLGLERDHPAARNACRELLDGGYRSRGLLSYTIKEDRFDLGVNGMVLALLSYFGHDDPRVAEVARSLGNERQSNGAWLPDRERIVVLEEQTSSHGGIGGRQNEPFVLVPASWDVSDMNLESPEALHRLVKRGLVSYRPGSGAETDAKPSI